MKDLFKWGQKGGKDEGEQEDSTDEGEEEGSEEEVSEEMSGDDEDGEDECAKKGSGSCAEGSPLLTLEDESTKTPGLFLVGPSVRHGELSFCFIYKFRQRFGVVADAIARGLGYKDTEDAVDNCRKMDMFLDDFSCCKAACGEACSGKAK